MAMPSLRPFKVFSTLTAGPELRTRHCGDAKHDAQKFFFENYNSARRVLEFPFWIKYAQHSRGTGQFERTRRIKTPNAILYRFAICFTFVIAVNKWSNPRFARHPNVCFQHRMSHGGVSSPKTFVRSSRRYCFYFIFCFYRKSAKNRAQFIWDQSLRVIATRELVLEGTTINFQSLRGKFWEQFMAPFSTTMSENGRRGQWRNWIMHIQKRIKCSLLGVQGLDWADHARMDGGWRMVRL